MNKSHITGILYTLSAIGWGWGLWTHFQADPSTTTAFLCFSALFLFTAIVIDIF